MAAMNVDKMSLKELVALETKLKSAIAEARTRESKELREKVAAMAKAHGFSVVELFGATPARKLSVGVAKYVNPEDATDTWTGRGRKPNWLVGRLKKGSKLADFSI